MIKDIVKTLALLLVGGLIVACEKDNFDEPTSSLTGRLVYQGEPILVEYERVGYELFQDGFGKTGSIPSAFTQEGEFAHVLFDGEYKMIIPVGQGPFVPMRNELGNTDTIVVDLRGSEDFDIEVTPYWMIRNPQLSAGEGSVSANFALEQIAMGEDERSVQGITLYVSKTAFANSQTNVATANLSGGDITDFNSISLNVEVPDIQPTQDYVFASIGVRINGVEDLIFSPTVKLDL